MISIPGLFNADLKFLVKEFPKVDEALHGISFETQPGGKGFNQALAVCRSRKNKTLEVKFLTQLGEDYFASMARKIMEREGMDASCLLSSRSMPTGAAMIMVEEKTADNMIVVAPGAASLPGEKEIKSFSEIIASSTLFMTNLETPLEAVKTGLRLARSYNVKTLLDPAPACHLPKELYAQIDFLTPNESEAEKLVGFSVKTLEDAERASRILCAWGVGVAIVTMGSLGVVTTSIKGTIRLPIFKLNEVTDTTGAGYALNGCFSTSPAEGNSLKKSLIFASDGAALCAGKRGAADAMAYRKEIDELLKTGNLLESGS